MSALVAGVDGDVLLRYRQLESWREILLRWDGDEAIRRRCRPRSFPGPRSSSHTDEQALNEEATSTDEWA